MGKIYLVPCGHPLEWFGLYRKDYDLATPESMAHPAKASWDLAFKILDHLKELGLLKEGDTVLDPMAGTSRFGIAAWARGYHSINVELEPRFVLYSLGSFEYNIRRYCICGEDTDNGYLRWLREAHARATLEVASQGAEKAQGQQSPGLQQDILREKMCSQEALGRDAQEADREPPFRGDSAQNIPEEFRAEEVSSYNRTEGANKPGHQRQEANVNEPHVEGGGAPNPNGLPADISRPRQRLSARTSFSDGASFGTATSEKRKSASSQREERRQSARELNSDAEFIAFTLTQHERQLAKSALSPVCQTCGKPVAPFPVIIQGDARNLSGLLQERGLVAVSSPPYANNELDIGLRPNRWAKIKDNPKFKGRTKWEQGGRPSDYGSTPGQIGSLPDKPIAITSPPYGSIRQDGGVNDLSLTKQDFHSYTDGITNQSDSQRGLHNPFNIANLPDRPLTAITSPPYEDSRLDPLQPTYSNPVTPLYKGFQPSGYGKTEGQIGQERGETYLEAMKIVYSEIAKVADVLVVVTKNPTRNGKLRRLDLDTIALLEQVGYKILCHHHAILFEEQEMGHLFEGKVKKPRGRLSFFKRLSYQKGSPVAMWEDVLVAVKNGTGGLCAVTSPPYGEGIAQDWTVGYEKAHNSNYGDAPGQIGKLKDQ